MGIPIARAGFGRNGHGGLRNKASGERRKDCGVGVYHVKHGKIVREEFVFGG